MYLVRPLDGCAPGLLLKHEQNMTRMAHARTCASPHHLLWGGGPRRASGLPQGQMDETNLAMEGLRDHEAMAQPGRRRGRGRTRPSDRLSLSSQPWMSQVRGPTTFQESIVASGTATEDALDNGMPTHDQSGGVHRRGVDLVLKHVYGYSTGRSRGNLLYADNGAKIVYPVGSIGVVYDKERRRQTFNMDHEGQEVAAVAVHAEAHLVATAEILSEDSTEAPRIIVWDDNSGATLRTIAGYHSRGK